MPRHMIEQLESRRLLATVTVNTLADDTVSNSLTSLREAIARAAAGDTVNFQAGVHGTITLTHGQLTIARNLNIAGPASSTIIVSGNNATRVLGISAGAVTIRGITIRSGRSDSG